MFIALGLYALTFEFCPIVVELMCLSIPVLGAKNNKRARVEEFKQTVKNCVLKCDYFNCPSCDQGAKARECTTGDGSIRS